MNGKESYRKILRQVREILKSRPEGLCFETASRSTGVPSRYLRSLSLDEIEKPNPIRVESIYRYFRREGYLSGVASC